MNRITFLLSVLLCSFVARVIAQNYEPQIYLGGNHLISGKGKNISIVEHKTKNYSDDSLSQYTYNSISSAIYDKDDRVKLFSNGEKIFDLDGIIPNGDKINGFYYSDCLMTTYPEDKAKVLVLTIGNNGLNRTKVDFHQSKFKVSNEKNVLICKDVSNSIAICQHENSVDKWIVVHSWRDDKFHIFLFSKDAIEEKAAIESNILKQINNGSIKLKFSPDGKMLIAMCRGDKMLVYNFDASLGAISYKSDIPLKSAYDFDFSMDAKWLYVSTFESESAIYRINLNENLQKKKVAILGNYVLSTLQLANNNQIMINTPNFISGIFELGTEEEYIIQPLIKKTIEQKHHIGLSKIELSQNVLGIAPKSEYIPNSFSPNDDGLNDDFGVLTEKFPLTKKIADYHFKVVSRIGKTIFSTNSIYEKWDGKYHGEDMPSEVYLWTLTCKTSDGKTTIENGEVLLLR